MSFNVNFYNMKDDPINLEKSLTETPLHIATSLQPYEPLSEITGRIIVQYDSDIDNCNYVSMLNKYYFITDRQLDTAQRIIIYLKTDVLATYSAGIKECDCIPVRNTTTNNPYITDNLQPYEALKTHFSLKPGPSGESAIDRLDYDNMHTIAAIIGGTSWEVIAS